MEFGQHALLHAVNHRQRDFEIRVIWVDWLGLGRAHQLEKFAVIAQVKDMLVPALHPNIDIKPHETFSFADGCRPELADTPDITLNRETRKPMRYVFFDGPCVVALAQQVHKARKRRAWSRAFYILNSWK
jgi:hypothetical protein